MRKLLAAVQCRDVIVARRILAYVSAGVLAPASVYAVDRMMQPLPFATFVAFSGVVAGLIAAGDWVAVERPRGVLRRRRRLGLCARCGYDLHGNVSRVCPECGAAAGA
jgi:hypothetical protein